MADFFYREVPFREHGQPASPAQIAKLEEELDAKFPDDYRRFLLTLDGGVVERNRGVVVSFLKKELRDQQFVSFWNLNEIPIDQRGYDFIKRVPNLIIPIGRFAIDYRACISLREQDYGVIYLWAPRQLWNTEDEELVQTEKELHFLAKSFNAFLDLFQLLSED